MITKQMIRAAAQATPQGRASDTYVENVVAQYETLDEPGRQRLHNSLTGVTVATKEGEVAKVGGKTSKLDKKFDDKVEKPGDTKGGVTD